MPQPVGRVPLGLLSLLDSKANGTNPNGLLEDIRGTLELLPLFGAYQRVALNATISGGAVQATGWIGTGLSTMIVPPGEIWRVLAISADGTVINGNPGFGVGFAELAQSNRFLLSIVQFATTGAGSHVGAGWYGEMWWPPHYVPDVFIQETVIGSLEFSQIRVDLLFERYKL